MILCLFTEDAKIFEKHGLDVDLIFMGASASIIQSMLSGAANVAGFGGRCDDLNQG